MNGFPTPTAEFLHTYSYGEMAGKSSLLVQSALFILIHHHSSMKAFESRKDALIMVHILDCHTDRCSGRNEPFFISHHVVGRAAREPAAHPRKKDVSVL